MSTIVDMQTLPATAAPLANPVPSTYLHGRWRLLAQVLAIVIAGLALVLFLVSVPINFTIRSTVCTTPPCLEDQLGPVGVQSLYAVGLTPTFYATYVAGLEGALAVIFSASALVIALRKPADWLALFVALMLVTFGTVTFSSTTEALIVVHPAWWWTAQAVAWVGDVAIMLFFFIFPNGRFVPRATVFIALLWGVMQGGGYFGPNTLWDIRISAPLFYNIFFPAMLISGFLAQIYRYRYVSHPAQRQQTKWVVFGVTIGLGGFLLSTLPSRGLRLEEHVPTALALGTVQFVFIVLIPLSVAIAILRYRLWEIDPIINRTLVYTALTVTIVGLYVVAVGTFGALFQTRGNFLISVLATGLAAVLFEPLRARLQRAVNRLMYGDRNDPYAVLSRLGQRLESTLAPDAVLPTIVETVAQALKLPLVEIAVQDKVTRWQGDRVTVGTGDTLSNGLPPLHPVILSYQGEVLGELRLAPRAPGEPFSPADQQLLQDLAHQAGIALHAVRLTLDLQRLTHDLQSSRERLVTAREEERRRLRRDLHDGLGPALANLTLQIEAAREFLTRDPARADALLADLTLKAQAAITDIRRLVYDLRPPTLDEFGLLFAVREQAAQYEHTGLQTTIHAPEPLPPLPAAVEVAAYRIIQEALTNVVRHAGAHTCLITVAVSNDLSLEIGDDGHGLPTTHHTGVGLSSMRERAEELGGMFTLESVPEGGVRVLVRLPLVVWGEENHGEDSTADRG